ncbi:MAG: TraR/DksA C4-type zinc finger protein [Deltaproteobacteria bacterium]|nr:TraR/DksA C4-type zinc finger protein [Deltaproteobacteria bacterium]
MKAQQIMETDDFKRCAEFHGHVCPGLAIGYKAAKTAMERLKEIRAEDEEMVAIVETDACSADAVQVLTGCTFGKGNFIHKDYGKIVVILLSRNTGKGVRVSMRPGSFAPDETHQTLLRKMMSGEANEDDKNRFRELHFKRACDVLEMSSGKLFEVRNVNIQLPPRARIEPSELCDICGEPTMRTKLEDRGGKKVCRDCAEKPY